MADALHLILGQFRDTVLTAITNLEFQLRDVAGKSGAPTGTSSADLD